jgi:hypothetical protein
MATVLQECTIEKQGSYVHFLWSKGLNVKNIYKEMFFFTVGSVRRAKHVKFLLMTKRMKRSCGSG